eukprot:scaffold262737_cov41-Prasinocladus_malaysianus.AAC.1
MVAVRLSPARVVSFDPSDNTSLRNFPTSTCCLRMEASFVTRSSAEMDVEAKADTKAALVGAKRVKAPLPAKAVV